MLVLCSALLHNLVHAIFRIVNHEDHVIGNATEDYCRKPACADLAVRLTSKAMALPLLLSQQYTTSYDYY